ncbi:DUF962 domain-containing protein [Inquilinus sp.]|jgi:uncharacterized membrane protein YGL010W|uniref:DUF962 domain-containing protein n=1 Tax=Inquilinus sp. TaxID=1932117 RepID=UPI003783289D
MASDLFDRQMAMYTSFHRDGRNRLTHFFGIPAIILAVLVALATIPLGAIDGWPVMAAIVVVLAIFTYLFGIALVLLAIFACLAAKLLGIPGSWTVTLADPVAASVWLLWIALDLGLGLAMAMVVIPGLVIAHAVAGGGSDWVTWTVAAVLFVGGWALQLVGHAYEGKRPAFLSNLFQLLIGPMFLMAETAFALGLRSGLKRRVEVAADARQSR